MTLGLGMGLMPEKEPRRRVDPLIGGLLVRLPKPGTIWPEEERKEWMATLEANLKLVYPAAPQGKPHGQSAPGTLRPTG